MDMCRVCLTTENELVPLNESVLAIYNLLTGLNITFLDGMPQYTCPTCKDTIGYFAEFREKCIASETTLREIIESKCDAKNTPILKEISSTVQHDANIDTIIRKAIEVKLEKGDSVLNENTFECDNYDAGTSSEYVADEKIERPKRKYKKRNKSPVVDVPEKKTDTESFYVADEKIERPKRKYKKRNKSPVVDVPEKKTDTELFCGLCPKSFECNTKMNNHIESHSEDQFCGLCYCPLVNRPQRFAHRMAHVPATQNKCHICKKKYRSPFYLEHHIRNVHLQSEGSKMSCNRCSSVFSCPTKYASHQNVHGASNFVCDYCDKAFNWKSQLRAHIHSHTSKPYVCDICGFSSMYPRGLINHKLRRHNPNKYQCKICGQVFRSQEVCAKHKCPRSQPGICPVCGKQFERRSILTRHQRTHSAEKKYECDRCPAKYKTKGALIVHKNRHDGNRTIQCPDCPSKFYSASVLITHRRIHTGEKPYVCAICKKGFSSGYNLKVHMKVHGLNVIVKKNTENEDFSFMTQE